MSEYARHVEFSVPVLICQLQSEQISIMIKAFETAWRDVAGNFSPDEVPSARERLARAIITVAPGWPHSVKTLAEAGLKELQSRYRSERRQPEYHAHRQR